MESRAGAAGSAGISISRAAEAQGGHLLEVLEAADLARRVAIEGEEGVVPPHAAAVVGDRDARLAAPLELDANGGRAGVESVLDQLLDHRRRALHHLAGG